MFRLHRNLLRAASLGLAGAVLCATPAFAATNTSVVAGISSIFGEETEEETPALGGVAVLDGIMTVDVNARTVLADSSVRYEMTEEEKEAQVELAGQIQEEAEVSPYANVAISQVNNYVNIRTEPSEEGEVVGKIYNNAAATILDTEETDEGTWYQIESGSVEGYIKSDYFVTGEEAEAIAYEVGHVTATVSTETLRLRSEASTESSTVTLLSEDEKYDMIGQEDGFVEIQIDDDLVGYVDSDYVDIDVTFEHAISLEEEQEALEAQRIAEESRAAEEAAEEAAAEAAASEAAAEAAEEAAREQAAETEAPATKAETAAPTTTAAPETEAATTKAPETEAETAAPSAASSSSVRTEIVNYALSFVGNLRYVYGGTSLTSGADCSGFVQQIYKHFGYSLPRTSDSQGSYGKSVSSSEMRPGDLVYYGGHIAIYIGNGQIVHASNEKSGVKISTWNYRTVKSIRNVIGD